MPGTTKDLSGCGKAASDPRRQLYYELVSGASGLVLALFMWGHMILVGSILTGERGFNWLAGMLEVTYIAQPTVVVILTLFLVHAALASRKIPAQLAERKRMIELGKGLARAGRDRPAAASPISPLQAHVESRLWIWQVRTGMVVLVLGSFHLILLGLDVLTPLFGERSGIEALTSMARVKAGLWLPYAILLLCVEFHASVGLYRLAVKWGVGQMLPRKLLHGIERILLWFFLGLGVVVLLVLAGVLPPPLAFLLTGSVT
jgi:fumarate reductase subunit C